MSSSWRQESINSIRSVEETLEHIDNTHTEETKAVENIKERILSLYNITEVYQVHPVKWKHNE